VRASLRVLGPTSVAVVAAALPWAMSARAEEPDAGLAVVVGAGMNVAGLIVGGAVLATSHSSAANSAGWLTMESSFVLSPFAAHAVEGEWGRGALFAAVPAACLAGSATLIGVVPDTIDLGPLPQQRVMWILFGIGQLASAVGIIDATFAPMRKRKVFIVPTVGFGHMGLSIGGIL
jgi:hypothetical protein